MGKTRTTGAVIVLLLATAIGATLAAFVVSLVLAILVGAVAGIAAAAIFLAVTRRGSPGPSSASAAAPGDGATRTRRIMSGLLTLNLRLRTAQVPGDVLARFERAIDLLRDLVPETNASFQGSSITREVNRSAEEYLPDLATRYVAVVNQSGAADQVSGALDRILDALQRASDAVTNRRVDDFEVEARFMSARFTDAAS